MLPEILIACDLGQVNDPTAICVIERRDEPTGRQEVVTGFGDDPRGWGWIPVPVRREQWAGRYDITHLERMELGTAYVAIPARLREIETSARQRWQAQAWAEDAAAGVGHLARYLEDAPVTLLVDGTGVGRPVTDLLREAGLAPISVVIHGGDQVIRVAPDVYRTPKRDLAGAVQAAMQARRLRAAEALPEWPALKRELANFKARISLSGHDTYAAGGGAEDWRGGGAHDDLVLSVSLGLWWGEFARAGERGAAIG